MVLVPPSGTIEKTQSESVRFGVMATKGARQRDIEATRQSPVAPRSSRIRRIGPLQFGDGIQDAATAGKAYDYLHFARGVDAADIPSGEINPPARPRR
jgi:hypothetical protein